MVERVAYVDESYREHETGGFYVLAAAVFDENDDRARAAMLGLRGGRRVSKVHWNEMDVRDRGAAVAAGDVLDGVHLVAVGSPVVRRRQERARAVTLRRLVFELAARGVARLWVESRQANLDRRDVAVVVAARRPASRRDSAAGAALPWFGRAVVMGC